MQTLYDTCQKYDNIEYLNEWFVTSIIHDGKNSWELLQLNYLLDTFYTIKGKALIIATGGAGRFVQFFNICTYLQLLMVWIWDSVQDGTKRYGVCTISSYWNFTFWNIDH